MSDKQNAGEEEHEFNPITTQADLDRIVGDRLARERKKYADYNDLKAKAEKLDELEDANQSELDKVRKQFESTKAELDELKSAQQVTEWKNTVAKDTGVPASVLRGTTEDDIRSHAESLKTLIKSGPVVPTGHMKPAGDGSDSDVRATVKKLFSQ
ncbi:hypothetical protein [Brevibacterium paucivorans]|uniref:hypothetical protein n=1 Tax=Brevibacterium paucivorans TaxID=170994 RepID=UPI00321A3C4C